MIDLRQGILIFGTATLLVALLCWVFSNFIALKSPPSTRASWTAGLAYIFASLLFWGGAKNENAIWAPIATIPGAAYFFWVFLSDFRKAWIADPDNLAEGMTLANDDWKVGAIRLVAIFVIFVAIAIGGGLGRELAAELLR